MGARALEGLDEVIALECLKCERAFEGCNGVEPLKAQMGVRALEGLDEVRALEGLKCGRAFE